VPAAASAQPGSTVLGAQRPVATDTPRVQEAGAFLAEQVGGALASVDSATSGSTPFYHLEITLADGARWSGVVGHRPGDADWSVSGQPTQLSPPPGEGDEVDTGSNDGSDDDD
jgi:hypothetical protein